jgi:hypothetical protein
MFDQPLRVRHDIVIDNENNFTLCGAEASVKSVGLSAPIFAKNLQGKLIAFACRLS